MKWDEASAYCKLHYAGLASIHSAEDQHLAMKECSKLVVVDEVPIKACQSSTEYSKQYNCKKAYDNNGVRDAGEFATKHEGGGWIAFQFSAKNAVTIGRMAFQQRWNKVDWVNTVTLSFSDNSKQVLQLRQTPRLESYSLKPVKTTYVKIAFTSVGKPKSNNGAKEIQFFESGNKPHGCWIGLNDQFQEKRLSWTDGSPVDYTWWAPGEPNNIGGHGT